uniref:Phospholipase A1 n=1 Tax=Salix viminalis TaxID=40686 RepID=A0A6N2KMC0_SALVM
MRYSFFESQDDTTWIRGHSLDTRRPHRISTFRFFSKNLAWPKVRSNVGNWIGYAAVSNDTKHFGRRDVAIAWRGTVTRLEWIADLMDFLKLISGKKIPCPDPTAKVESGFLDLYSDKYENCGFCKYSAREQILVSGG